MERILSFEGGSSRSHYVEESFWRRLRTCRKTDYFMNECFGTTDFDNNNRLITLSAIITSGLHCISSPTYRICAYFKIWGKPILYIYCLIKVCIWSLTNMIQPMMTWAWFATMLVLSCFLRPSLTTAQPHFSQKCTFSLIDLSSNIMQHIWSP